MKKPIVLTFNAYYLPGFKAGGPIRTLANMVDQLGDEIDFRIIAKDRDFEDKSPYPNIKVDEWNVVGKAHVFYASAAQQSFRNLVRLIRNTEHDMLYFNSFFDWQFSIQFLLMRKLRLIPQKPVVLAPRGEFSPGALGIKTAKKNLFINVSKALRLYEGITWHASSDMEKEDIERWFDCNSGRRGKASRVQVAMNLSSKSLSSQSGEKQPVSKKPGSLRLVFLSRISPKKNLDFALNVLRDVDGDISFDIYGPVDRDQKHWEKCEQLISEMPSNVVVQYKGAIENTEVRNTLSQYHAFLFPTRGENFGHVIMESLMAGCPVVLSDQTPWQNLEEKKSGWDIPLSQPEKFQSVLRKLVAMDKEELEIHSCHAMQHAMQAANSQDIIEKNRQLFLR